MNLLVQLTWLRLGGFQQLCTLALSPEVTKAHVTGRLVVCFTYQCGNGGAHLNPHRIAFAGKNAGIRGAVRRHFAGFVFVSIEAVNSNRVKSLQILLPHPRKGQAIQPGIVGDEADDTLPCLRNAPFRHTEEAHVEIVQALPLRLAHPPRGAVGVGERPFFVHRQPGKAVVGRVAQDHQDGLLLLDPLGPVPLLLQFGEGQRFVDLGFPAGEGVGEEHPRPFVAGLGQGRVQLLQGEAHLQVGNHERRRHDLETEHPPRGGGFHPRPRQRSQALAFQVGGDAAQHCRQIGAGAAAGVQHHHVLRGQAVPDVQVLFEGVVHPRHHGLHHLRGCVPDAQLLAQGGIKGFQEGFIEVGHRLASGETREEGGAVHPFQGGGAPVQHFH